MAKRFGSALVTRALVGVACLAIILVCTGGVALAAARGATKYTSSASVIYGNESSDRLFGSNSSSTDVERTLATQAQVVLGDSVMKAASDQLGVSVRSLTRSTLVENLPDSNVLRISASAGSADAAARRAQAIADLYITDSKKQAQDQFATQAAALDAPIAQLRQIIGASGSQGQKTNRTALNAALTSLIQQQLQLQAAASSETGPAQILSGAIPPTSPSSISTLTGAAVGAAIGIVIVIGVLMILYWWIRRRTPGPRALLPG